MQVYSDLAELLLVRQLDRLIRVVRFGHCITAPRQTTGEDAGEHLIVVDHQKIHIAHACFSVLDGVVP